MSRAPVEDPFQRLPIEVEVFTSLSRNMKGFVLDDLSVVGWQTNSIGYPLHGDVASGKHRLGGIAPGHIYLAYLIVDQDGNMLIYLKHDAHDKIDEVVRAALKQVTLDSMNSHVFIDTAWGTHFTMSAQDARRKYGVRIDTMSAYNPPIRHAWEMTYDELLGELESLNSVVDREGLDRLRPLLAEVYPEYVDVDYRDYTQDPWGIGRAIQAGTEIPRAPTVDLSQRLRKLKEQHGIEYNPPDVSNNPGQPSKKLKDLEDGILTAVNLSESGFYFQEGGCFGFAYALNQFLEQKGIANVMKISTGDYVHAWVEVDGVKIDSEGIAMRFDDPGTTVTSENLKKAAEGFGVDSDQFDNDVSWATEILVNTDITHNPPDAKTLIGTSEDGSLEFHLVNGDVYRVKAGWSPDAYGLPMGMRWECSLEQWNRYRNSVFSWVIDAGDLDPGDEE